MRVVPVCKCFTTGLALPQKERLFPTLYFFYFPENMGLSLCSAVCRVASPQVLWY